MESGNVVTQVQYYKIAKTHTHTHYYVCPVNLSLLCFSFWDLLDSDGQCASYYCSSRG